MPLSIKNIIGAAAKIGSSPGDDDEIRLQKSLLVLSACPFIIAGAGWGIIYLAYGEVIAGFIPISYSVFSLFSIMLFAFTRKFQLFRFSQLLLILLLPAALMFALGGFVQGSAVILWALISPLGAMLFDSPKKAPLWFAAFLTLVVLSGLLQPFQHYQNHLSVTRITFFFVINFVGVSSLIFFMVYYFFRQKNIFQERSEQLLLNILPK